MGANPYENYEDEIIKKWGKSVRDATFFVEPSFPPPGEQQNWGLAGPSFKSGLNTNQRGFMNQGLQSSPKKKASVRASSKGRTPPPIRRGKRGRTFKFSPIISPIRTSQSRKARPKSRAKSPKLQKKSKFGRKNQLEFDFGPFNQMKTQREQESRQAIDEAARIMSRGVASKTLQGDKIDQTAYYLSNEGEEEERRNLNQALGLSPNTGRPRLGRLPPSPRRVANTAMSTVRGNRKYAGGKKSKKRRSRKRRTKQTRKRRRRRRN